MTFNADHNYYKKWCNDRDRRLDNNSLFSSSLAFSEDCFRIFSYKWKKFFACHQIHTKMTLNDDRMKMIYRERRTRRLYFDQVLDFSIHHFYQVLNFLYQKIIFEFFHADKKISLHVIKFIRKWHSTLIVDIIENDVMIEMKQKKKTISFHFNFHLKVI
jgi:hypothetical protein